MTKLALLVGAFAALAWATSAQAQRYDYPDAYVGNATFDDWGYPDRQYRYQEPIVIHPVGIPRGANTGWPQFDQPRGACCE